MTKDQLNIAISVERGLDELVDWTTDTNWPTLLRELPHVSLVAANDEWTCDYNFRDKQRGFDWDSKAYASRPGEAVARCWLKWKDDPRFINVAGEIPQA